LSATGHGLIVIAADAAGFNVRSDPQAALGRRANKRLVVVRPDPASFKVGLNFKRAGHGLIVVAPDAAGFDAGPDFEAALGRGGNKRLVVIGANTARFD